MEVSEQNTPKISIPRAANQRARAMAKIVTNMREGKTNTWWGGGKGLRGFLPMPLPLPLLMPLLRKKASFVGRAGGESGGNMLDVRSNACWLRWNPLVDPRFG